ncbi:MAG: protein phosphatase 2C domain-containing protein [Gammaproteobacteria bacterium]|jgi:PPM family protein phosphatase
MVAAQLEIVSRTDVGLKREHNEDRLAVFPDMGLVVLADGMGGYNAGEVASQLVIDAVATELVPLLRKDVESVGPDEVVSAVKKSNLEIFEAVKRNAELDGMGTTIVLAVFRGKDAVFAHVGDSRLYRFRAGRLEPLTSDHSMLQELLNQGMFASEDEAIDAGVPSSVLTRGLGVELDVEVDIREEVLRDGDIFLLCSDGLSGMIPDEAIDSVLGSLPDDLSGAADLLVKLALEGGGKDNISLILARCHSKK